MEAILSLSLASRNLAKWEETIYAACRTEIQAPFCLSISVIRASSEFTLTPKPIRFIRFDNPDIYSYPCKK
jgi:hypothetical protein